MSRHPIIANTDHDFIRMLQTFVDDPKHQELHKQIGIWRTKLQHSAFERARLSGIRGTASHVQPIQLPQEIVFAIPKGDCIVGTTLITRILKGNYIPSLEQIKQIIRDRGVKPDDENVQELITAGEDYIQKNQNNEHPAEREEKTTYFKPKMGKFADRSTKSELSRIICDLRKSKRLSIEKLALNADLDRDKIGNLERDVLKLQPKDWEDFVKPILDYLKIDEPTRMRVKGAFGARLEELAQSKEIRV